MKGVVRLVPLVVIALLVVAGPAQAAKKKATRPAAQATLKAQVVGQPYGAKGGKTAVPIMVDKLIAKGAGLKSRTGILLIEAKRTEVRDGKKHTISTRVLRLNDRIHTRTLIRPTVRRDSYWRIPTKSVVVVARSTTLSALEIQELIDDLRSDLDALYNFTTTLANYTLSEFKGVRADIAAIKADVAALVSRVATLETQLAALTAQLDAVKNALEDKIDEVDAALKAQLQALLTRVTALENGLALLDGRLDTLEATVLGIQASITSINTAITNLTTRIGDVEEAVDELNDLLGTLPGGTNVADLIGDLQADLLDVTGDLSALDTATTAALGGLDTRLDLIEPLVSGLGTNMTAVLGELGGTVGAGAITGSTIDALDVDLTAAEGNITTALANAATAQTAANNAATAAAAAQADVNSLYSDVCDAGGVVPTLNALNAIVDLMPGIDTGLLSVTCTPL